MANFTPVDGDPFATAAAPPVASAPAFTPVDHDPFAPGATAAPSPYAGQSMSATPDEPWYGYFNDGVRLLTNRIPFSDRLEAGFNTVTGLGLPGADYATNLQNERWRDAALAAQHPMLSKVLGFTGGGAAALATLPEGALAGGSTMLARALSGAGAGASYGAAQGASDAPDLTNAPDVASRMGTGAALGGAIGGALPVVASGIGGAYGAAARMIDGGAPGVPRAAQKHS